MSFQPGANVYTQGFGSRPENVEVPHIDVRAPATTDILYPIGKRWINTATGNEYCLGNFSISNGVMSANWAFLGGTSGDLNTLTTDDTTVVTPSSGNINLAGTGSITTTGSGATATVQLTNLTNHAVLVGAGTATVTKLAVGSTGQALMGSTGADPAWTGSPSFSGSVTAGTGLSVTSGGATVTAGDITATAGNVIVNGAAKQYRCHGGAATDFIGQATLVNGTLDVANTNIAATDRIIVTRSAKNASTAYGTPLITITPATKFNITACKSDTTTETNDVSTFDYFIIRQV